MTSRPRSPHPRSLEDALFHDPEEQKFLVPLLNDAPGQQRSEAIARYTAWLIERGDPVGEWLQIAQKLASPTRPPDARALLDRFAALGKHIPRRWQALLLDRSWVLNCGEAAHELPPVRFAFECDRTWESFAHTSDPSVRYCDRCDQRVHACETQAEAVLHAMQGHCISISRMLARTTDQRLTRNVTGQPHTPSSWASEIFGREVYVPRR